MGLVYLLLDAGLAIALVASQHHTLDDVRALATTAGIAVYCRHCSGWARVPSGGTLATYTYAYDLVGNKTSQNLNGASTTLSYNAANEMTQATGAISKTLSWDADGNQTGDSTGTSFSYNSANQTTSVKPSGGSTEVMGYSGPGQHQRVVAGSTTYQHDVTGISKLSSGITTTDMVTIPNYGKPVEESVQGVGYYFINDGQGNVVMVTNSQGNVANQYSYDPQGNYTSKSETVSNPVGFDGLYVDPATGMWFLPTGSVYDATTGNTTQFSSGFAPGELADPAAWEATTGMASGLADSMLSVSLSDRCGFNPVVIYGDKPDYLAWWVEVKCNFKTQGILIYPFSVHEDNGTWKEFEVLWDEICSYVSVEHGYPKKYPFLCPTSGAPAEYGPIPVGSGGWSICWLVHAVNFKNSRSRYSVGCGSPWPF